jgi:bifunctional non-homologous end joining protein LigD
VTFVAFDVLRVDGHDVMCNPWSERRPLLEQLGVERSSVRLAEVFDDGPLLFAAVCEHGLEGIVAKRRTASTGPVIGAGRRSRTRRTGGVSPRLG